MCAGPAGARANITGGAVKSRRCAGRRGHGAAGHGFGEGWSCEDELAGDGVEDGCLVEIVLVVVFVVLTGGELTSAPVLGLVEVFAVEGPDSVRTLLRVFVGVVGR